MVMTIVPTQREDRYAAIKRMMYCDLKLASQVQKEIIKLLNIKGYTNENNFKSEKTE